MKLAKFTLFILGLVVAMAANANQPNRQAIVSKNVVSGDVELYRQDPFSEEGYAAGQRILDFAEKSDLVLISISTDIAPWLSDDSIKENLRAMMLLAFIVGSVDSQLKKGKAFNSACSGLQEVSELLKRVASINANYSLDSARINLAKANVTNRCAERV